MFLREREDENNSSVVTLQDGKGILLYSLERASQNDLVLANELGE